MGLREFLSILPEYVEHDDGTETEIPPRWWNWHWEHFGHRLRVTVGDLAAMDEHEHGHPSALVFQIGAEIGSDTGQFDGYSFARDEITPKFHDHSFDLIIGRWGIYIAVRGRKR